MTFPGSWSASDFFRGLLEKNILATANDFRFAEVSGLSGLADLLNISSDAPNILAVDDTSEGYASLTNTPSRRMVKTIYMSMRHAPEDMTARAECFEIMHEIFRQFMSVINREQTRLSQTFTFIDPRIQFNEMDRYFATGSACAFFQLAVDSYVDMRYRPEEWNP